MANVLLFKLVVKIKTWDTTYIGMQGLLYEDFLTLTG
jgi:hypothetical protein